MPLTLSNYMFIVHHFHIAYGCFKKYRCWMMKQVLSAGQIAILIGKGSIVFGLHGPDIISAWKHVSEGQTMRLACNFPLSLAVIAVPHCNIYLIWKFLMLCDFLPLFVMEKNYNGLPLCGWLFLELLHLGKFY